MKSTQTAVDDQMVDHRDVIVGEDSRAMQLSIYVLAERLVQCEYHLMQDEIHVVGTSETLITQLEGGFRGFHNMSPGELWSEWNTKEELFYELYESNSLPWELYEEDPLVALERDETGEVANG